MVVRFIGAISVVTRLWLIKADGESLHPFGQRLAILLDTFAHVRAAGCKPQG